MNPLGRFFFALPFMISSIFYFRSAAEVVEAMPAWIPGGEIWVYLSAIVFAYASTSILVLKQTRVACFMLAGIMIGTVALVHLPNIASEDLATTSMSYLLKDLSLGGAALYFAMTLPQRSRRKR
jgi:uncharacterized membrane protein YphA (DoxX/SURF4 family)